MAEFHLAEIHLAEIDARPRGTGAVQRRRQRSVKPPENSRAFTASVNGLQAGGSRDLFSGGAHPYPQGLSDTGNLTFVHNLVALLVGVLAIPIARQHLLKYR